MPWACVPASVGVQTALSISNSEFSSIGGNSSITASIGCFAYSTTPSPEPILALANSPDSLKSDLDSALAVLKVAKLPEGEALLPLVESTLVKSTL